MNAHENQFVIAEPRSGTRNPEIVFAPWIPAFAGMTDGKESDLAIFAGPADLHHLGDRFR